MKVCHIISGLNKGGAEGALFRLLEANHDDECLVISLSGEGFYSESLQSLGFKVLHLNFKNPLLAIPAFFNLVSALRSFKPDVIQTWMYHADLIGGLAARLSGFTNIFWGIRHANLDKDKNKKSTLLVVRVCAILSTWLPAKIISCSTDAVEKHIAFGYNESGFVYIPNGFNTALLQHQTDKRKKYRKAFKLGDDDILIGMLGRWHPQKDHDNLVKALTQLPKNVKCLLAGSGMDEHNQDLMKLLEKEGVVERFILFGQTDDVAGVMSALDLHVLSSAGEAFPNVLAEAMLCETPCVSTDVGDAAEIVGSWGWLVPAKKSQNLAEAISQALVEMSDPVKWNARKQGGLSHIEETFSMEKMSERYKSVWQNKESSYL